MKLIFTLALMLALSSVSYLHFSDIRQIKDPSLVKAVNEHLLETHREDLAQSFNRSLENESFGRILNRAADLIATSISIISMEKSQLPVSSQLNPNVIVQVSYFVAKTSEPAELQHVFLKFTLTGPGQWTYRHNSTEADYYLNFLGFE
jgi:hypothetical protein